MKIEFVNHASVIFEYEEIVLMTDPWYKGIVVNNGWDLLVPSKFQTEDFSKVTHLWFSHEHSDHFVPSLLNEIPVDVRKSIIILYQKTEDKKVVSYCRENLKFKEVIELDPSCFFFLTSNFKIKCTPHSSGDSWMYISTPEINILNLNDCVVKDVEQANLIKEAVGKVDVLMTQFGYAHKIGNKEDSELRRLAALEKLERIKIQIETINPAFIIPFASFSVFCHEENFYMNNEQVKVNYVYDFINENFRTTPIVLYPGDIWDMKTAYSSDLALIKYLNAYNNISRYDKLKSDPISLDELKINSLKYGQKLVNKNPSARRLINKIRTKYYISDLELSVVFLGELGFKVINCEKEKCDVVISSDSLNYILKFEWGGMTCVGNARYFTTIYGDIYKFDLLNRISELNNQNLEYVWSRPNFFRRLISKL